MNDFGDLPKPDFKEYSLNNFGFILRDSASLTPDIFPYKVGISKKSNFFHSVYEGVYKGKGDIIRGSDAKVRPKGRLIEHKALLASNDLGEIMVSNNIFEGNMIYSLTRKNEPEFQDYTKTLRSIPMPPGWKTFGSIHSHPVFDAINESALILSPNTPKIYDVPITWSGGDFNSFIMNARYGYQNFTTLGLINRTLLSLMVSSKTTIEKLNGANLKDIESNPLGLPPYKRFGELGIILYAGIHNIPNNDKIILDRII